NYVGRELNCRQIKGVIRMKITLVLPANSWGWHTSQDQIANLVLFCYCDSPLVVDTLCDWTDRSGRSETSMVGCTGSPKSVRARQVCHICDENLSTLAF